MAMKWKVRPTETRKGSKLLCGMLSSRGRGHNVPHNHGAGEQTGSQTRAAMMAAPATAATPMLAKFIDAAFVADPPAAEVVGEPELVL